MALDGFDSQSHAGEATRERLITDEEAIADALNDFQRPGAIHNIVTDLRDTLDDFAHTTILKERGYSVQKYNATCSGRAVGDVRKIIGKKDDPRRSYEIWVERNPAGTNVPWSIVWQART